MADRNLPHREPHSAFALSDLSVLAGLVTAFGIFLFMTFRHSTDPPGGSVSEAKSLMATPTATVEHSQVQPSAGKATRPERAVVQRVTSSAIPAATFGPEKVIHPPVDPALAEKPSLPQFPIQVVEQPLPKRPQPMTEAELVAFLKNVPFAGLDAKQADLALRAVGSSEPSIGKSLRGPEKSVLALLDESTTRDLPFAEVQDCQLEPSQAVVLDKYSQLLREQMMLTDKTPGRHFRSRVLSDRDMALVQALKMGRKWQTPDAIPAMAQILQVESLPVRLQLVEWLSGFGTPEATQALLARSVFDISPEVRLAANTALKRLYHVGYRQQLLEALRYPWPEVSWNAAETLVAVNDQQAATELNDLLSAPDPTLPFPDKSGNMLKSEIVGIQHSRNCLLCHAPSRSKSDLVRGLVGTVIQPAGPSVLGGGFMSRSSGGGYYKRSTESTVALPGRLTNDLVSIDIMMRADVTYLRQDFSLAFVKDKDEFPRSTQRVDYVVRTRRATPEEISRAEQQSAGNPFAYPQRDAVLYALRKLESKSLVAQSEN